MGRSSSGTRFTIAHGLVKTVAIVGGFALTLLALMSVVGLITPNGWVRLIAALLAALLLPAVLIDRLLPDDTAKARGLPTDILALFYLGFGVAFVAGAHKYTGPWLVKEADRQVLSGWNRTAKVTYFLAGAEVSGLPAEPVPQPAASASSSAGTEPDASVLEDGAVAEAGSSSTQADGSTAMRDARPEKTPAELFKELSPAVVTIIATRKDGMDSGGTGFLVDTQGTIATNHHVIEGASRVQIKFINGAKFSQVDLLTDDAAVDIALLAVDLNNPADAGPKAEAKPLELGDSDKVVVGERAVSIGNPLGLEHTLTDGLVSARRMYEGRAWIQMSVPVSPGNSGGPLFNMRGEVIGITTAQIGGGIMGRAQNLNLAVPINVLKGLIHSSYPQRHKFGDDSGSSQW